MEKNDIKLFNSLAMDCTIEIKEPNKTKYELLFILEITINKWYLSEDGVLYENDLLFGNSIIEYEEIAERIIDLPKYTLRGIFKTIIEYKKIKALYGNSDNGDMKYKKIKRLLTIETQFVNFDDFDFVCENDCLRDHVGLYEYWWDISDMCYMYDIDEKEFYYKNLKELKKKYNLLGLAEWYKENFPECSRQTMLKDFKILNDIGCIFEYDEKKKMYKSYSLWYQTTQDWNFRWII